MDIEEKIEYLLNHKHIVQAIQQTVDLTSPWGSLTRTRGIDIEVSEVIRSLVCRNKEIRIL